MQIRVFISHYEPHTLKNIVAVYLSGLAFVAQGVEPPSAVSASHGAPVQVAATLLQIQLPIHAPGKVVGHSSSGWGPLHTCGTLRISCWLLAWPFGNKAIVGRYYTFLFSLSAFLSPSLFPLSSLYC